MSLPHLIMGLLNYGPASGYELNKAFQASVQHFWHTEQSQIYRALYKLRDQGWLTVEDVEQAGVPDKKLYTLTIDGRTELHRWLAEVKGLTAVHEAWVGQLFFGAELESAELETLLQARMERLQATIQIFMQELPTNAAHFAALYEAGEAAWFWELTIDYGLRKLQFDLQWAQEALAAVQNRS